MGKVNYYQGRGGGQGHPLQNNYGNNSNAPPTMAAKTHWAITKGLKKVFFTFGNLKDAEEFEKTKTTLSWYISTQVWQGYGLALQAMDKMADPEIAKTVKPEKVKI